MYCRDLLYHLKQALRGVLERTVLITKSLILFCTKQNYLYFYYSFHRIFFNKMKQFKIVLMGSGGVGKSSMAGQYIKHIFETTYEPTIEEIHKKTVEIENEQCCIELMDTAGVDQFTQMREVYIREGHVFVLVYSIAEQSTFEDVQIIHEEIVKSKCSNQVPIILVGNKRDLEASDRMVPREDGLEMEKKWPFSKFIEISAMEFSEVENVFVEAIKQVKSFESNRKDRINALHREASGRKKQAKKCIVM